MRVGRPALKYGYGALQALPLSLALSLQGRGNIHGKLRSLPLKKSHNPLSRLDALFQWRHQRHAHAVFAGVVAVDGA